MIVRAKLLKFLAGVTAVQMVMCGGAGAANAYADSIKDLVLEDCNAAKEALAHANADERAELVPYFGQVLQLTLAGMAPPPGQPAPHLPSKIQDNNPVPINRVDPLRVVEDDRERNARRCAVDLLGMVQGGAAPALPALIRYASQHELDDASRDIADETITSISERVLAPISDDLAAALVATLKGERPELSRTVLLIVAPHNAQQIAVRVLSGSDIPLTAKTEVLDDLARVDRPAVTLAVGAVLVSANPAAQNSVFDAMARLKWTGEELTPQLTPLLFSENSDLKLNAARQIIAVLSAGCRPVDVLLKDRLIDLLSSDDAAGEAAVGLLRCLRQQQQFPSTGLHDLALRDEPLVRGRVASLASAVSQAGRDEFELLKKLLIDPEIIVQRAAINALGELKLEKRSEVSALLLRYAQKFEKKNPAESIPLLTDALARQIPKFEPLNSRSGWIGVADDFFSLEAVNNGMVPITMDQQKTASSILSAFSSDGIEIPLRMIKTGNDQQRFLGAEILIAYSSGSDGRTWPRQYVPALVGLLGDTMEDVRTLAMRTILQDIGRFRAGLTQGVLSKNPRQRGAAALLLFQLKSDSPANVRATKSDGKAEVVNERDWISQAGCNELLVITSSQLLANSALRAPLQARVIGCLAAQNAAANADVMSVFEAFQDDKESTALAVQAALDGKFNPATVLALLASADSLGLPVEQVRPLVDSILQHENDDIIQRVLPVIARLADQGATFAPQLRKLADRPDQNGKLRCLLYGTLSAVAPASVAWNDFFLAEIHLSVEKNVGFATCARDIASEAAQPALEDLLKQLPLRSRAAVFERISALSRVKADEPLTAAISRSLAEPNQELRCQATRSAIRIGLSSAGIENAVRRGLYNECWNDLATMRGALIVQAAATQVLTTPRNTLEEIRATELQ